MSFLYVIRCGDYHKIGVANNLQSRLASLQTGNPIKLEIVTHYEFENPEPIEQAIHQKFVKKNVSGEWFSLKKEDLVVLDSICAIFDGKKIATNPEITEVEADAAEVIGEINDSLSQEEQIDELIKNGWRWERAGSGKYRGKYYIWRKNENGKRYSKRIESGATLSDEITKKLEGIAPRRGKGNRTNH